MFVWWIYLFMFCRLPAVLHFVDSVMVRMNVLEINAIYFHVVVVLSFSAVVMVLGRAFSEIHVNVQLILPSNCKEEELSSVICASVIVFDNANKALP